MLKLNVGFTKKVGEANFGSRGASVNLDLELEGGLVGDPDRLKDRIRQLFVLAKTAVDEELNGQPQSTHGRNGATTSGGSNGSTVNGTTGTSNGNGHVASNGRLRDGTRKATASQVRAIHAIGARQRLDLAAVLHERFGIHDPAELSITEASELIDGLNNAGNWAGSKR